MHLPSLGPFIRLLLSDPGLKIQNAARFRNPHWTSPPAVTPAASTRPVHTDRWSRPDCPPRILLPIRMAAVGFHCMTGRTLITLIAALAAFAPRLDATDPVVRILDTPEKGIQPRLVVDDAGTVHLVYYRGKDDGGDLFYTRKDLNREFSKPVRVNSIPRSAIAAGTIRGAQIAVGRNRRVYVVWNSSNVIDEKAERGPSMFFTRSLDVLHPVAR